MQSNTEQRYVRVSKTGVVDNPRYKSAESIEDYRDGFMLAPPVEYWLTGTLIFEPKIGERIHVLRDCRNGVKALGNFTSSPIAKIEGNKYYTLNSIYTIENIPCPY